MPAPYSDNLYSGEDFVDDDEEQQTALSPVDGYFHASSPSVDANVPQSSSSANLQQHLQQHHHRTSANVPSVPNVLVEDPTLREQGAAAKAREAAEERRLNTPSQPSSSPSVAQTTTPYHTPDSQASSPSQPTTSPTTPHHSHRRGVDDDNDVPRSAGHTSRTSSLPFSPAGQNETTPLFQSQQQHQQPPRQQHQGDAPPAYSPPETTAQSPQQPGYQTFVPTPVDVTMGVPEEHQRLLPRQPESMGDLPGGEKPSYWQRVKGCWAMRNFRQRIKSILGVLVIFSIVFMLFSGFTLDFDHHHDSRGTDPDKPPKMGDNDLQWKPNSICLNKVHRFAKLGYEATFTHGRSLTIVQAVDDSDGRGSGWSPHISGEVRLLPTTGDAPGKVELEVISNDKDLSVQIDADFDSDEQLVTMTTPRHSTWGGSMQSACIQIRATVWVPKDALLTSLAIKTIQLDIAIKEGLTIGPDTTTSLETVSGDVRTPKPGKDDADQMPYTLNSREIYIKTISGDVLGWMPLYDLLKIRTASGDVKIGISPKESDGTHPKSAVLDVNTISGDVLIRQPSARILTYAKPENSFPPRDYIVKMKTASGDVGAELAVSSEATWETQSGDLSLRLWPVLDSRLLAYGGARPLYTTDTKSGDQQIQIHEPRWTSIDVVDAEQPATPGATPPTRDPDDADWAPADDDDPYLIIHPHEQDINVPPGASSRELDRRSADALAAATTTPVFGCLTSKHNSISGYIKLVYPSSWEGQLTAKAISGSQKFRGEDLEVSHGSGVLKYLTGHKGHGSSRLDISTISGDQNVLIGREGRA